MDGVTYFVGYQRGAAPLFVPMDATRAGPDFAAGGGRGNWTRTGEGEGGTLAKGGNKPWYIGADTFASALVDLLVQGEDGKPAVSMRDEAAKLVDRIEDDSALKAPLQAMANLGAETVDDHKS